MSFEINDAEVTLGAGEEKRISDAVEALKKDPHAPRELQIKVTIHVHNEYPKHLYKGKESVIVNGEDEEAAKIAEGFGKFEVVEEEPAS